MKLYIVPFLLITLLPACSSQTEPVEMAKSEEQRVISSNSAAIEENENPEDFSSWVIYQDSLRNVLRKSKPNKVLKASILEELYLRGLVKELDNKLSFKLPFNLHGYDCGAPDCYSTDISFKIPFDSALVFPAKIPFDFHEHGCLEKESKRKGTFILKEKEATYINYYSPTTRSNLLIIKDDEGKGQVYYFEEVKADSIKGGIMTKLLEESLEEGNAPFRISTMLLSEYESFLKE